MAEPANSAMYDRKTILFRIFMVLVYVIFGSGVFHLLEKDEAARKVAMFENYYNKTMTSILSRYVPNSTEMKIVMTEIRHTFLQEVFPKEWDFLGGFNISVQAITTVGYGSTVPRTVAGRLFLIAYATMGIPLMAMMLTTFGEKMKHTIKSNIISFERNILKKTQPQNIQRKVLIAVFVLTTACVCTISAISSKIENWDFTLALYVWFVTLTTIGFGDYTPEGTKTTNPIYGTLESIYVIVAFFVSLSLTACILHALADWVQSKAPPTTEDIKRSLSRFTSSLSTHREEPMTNISKAMPCPDAYSST